MPPQEDAVDDDEMVWIDEPTEEDAYLGTASQSTHDVGREGSHVVMSDLRSEGLAEIREMPDDHESIAQPGFEA